MSLSYPTRRGLSWTPVRDGSIYCSPACGGKCKWSSYQRARKKAQELVSELGPGWKPRIFENVGWYFEAVRDIGSVSVYRNAATGTQNYMAILLGRYTGTGETATESILDAIEQSRQDREEMKKLGRYIDKFMVRYIDESREGVKRVRREEV